MSLSDDIFDIEDYFDVQVKCAKDKVHARSVRRAWKRILSSHADMERAEMKTEPVIRAVSTILHAFNVERVRDDS